MNYFKLKSIIRVVELENDLSGNLEELFKSSWILLNNNLYGKLILIWV